LTCATLRDKLTEVIWKEKQDACKYRQVYTDHQQKAPFLTNMGKLKNLLLQTTVSIWAKLT